MFEATMHKQTVGREIYNCMSTTPTHAAYKCLVIINPPRGAMAYPRCSPMSKPPRGLKDNTILTKCILKKITKKIPRHNKYNGVIFASL